MNPSGPPSGPPCAAGPPPAQRRPTGDEEPEQRQIPLPRATPAAPPRIQGRPAPAPPRPGRRAELPAPARFAFFTGSPLGLRLRIGTSGYSFSWWHNPGSFYDGVPASREFERYAAEFDTLELNATFYRWFQDPAWEGWARKAAAVRPTFEYVVKAHQFLTHRKKLIVDDAWREAWARFWASCTLLGEHLGPVLFQLPETFALHPVGAKKKGKGRAQKRKRHPAAVDDEEVIDLAEVEEEEEGAHSANSHLWRLEAVCAALPPECRAVFEFRHSSWYCEEVYDVLRRHNCCLALVEVSGANAGGGTGRSDSGWCATLRRGANPPPEGYPLTSDWGAYVRFHGRTGKYVGPYGEERMAAWAWQLKAWAQGGRRVYAAFNNTDDGVPPGAITDARLLAAALSAFGVA